MTTTLAKGFAAAALICGSLFMGGEPATAASSSPNWTPKASEMLNTAEYARFRGRYRGGFSRGRGFRGGYGRRGYGRGGYYRRGPGAGAVLGGLAAGALIGGAIASQAAPGPAYAAPGGTAAYCSQRFKSYDPGSGSYLGYDGQRHSCP